jgi:DNA polymerase-3 subunit beta
MELTLDRVALLAKLQTVVRATAVRSAIETLSGVLLVGEGDSVELAATDGELSLRSRLPATVEQPGSALVPGRLVVDIVRALDTETLSIRQDASAGEVMISARGARFAVRILPAQDFPRLPSPEGGAALELPAAPLARTIERVARAASRDETRPVLTGILVSVDGDGLRMVATDSYRLSVKQTPLDGQHPDSFEANVPARAMQELGRILGDASVEQVGIATQDNQVVFRAGETILSSRVIEGQFPNYQQLLPDSYEHEVTAEKGELLAVVRRVSLMAQRNAPLRMRFEQGSVTVAAQTPDVGQASEEIPINYQGEPLEIGFNPQFLQDGLDSVETDQLTLRLISPLRPGLIEAASGDEEQAGKFLYLIMPVRLNV